MASTLSPEAPPAWEWRATGTRWRIYHSGGVGEDAALLVVAQVEADEARWSRFREDSELTEINRQAGRRVSVSAETAQLLAACAHWHEQSEGVFQPLVGAALKAWGYVQSIERAWPFAQESPLAQPIEGAIDLDEAGRSVLIPEGTELDVGGIGKGWMASRAGEVLARASADGQLLVDAGGDLVAVRGTHLVTVEDPVHPAADQPRLTLHAGEAVATSGHRRRQWVNGDGEESHHLIDPATGAPGVPAHATVVAGDGAAADVLAKVLALRPHTLEQLDLPARVVTPDGARTNAAWLRRLT